LLALLTCRLCVAPGRAWRELAQLQDERMPSLVWHAASLAAWTALVCALIAVGPLHADFSHLLRICLAAISGCLGATAACVCVIPKLRLAASLSQPQLVRYASLCSLPLAASAPVWSFTKLTVSLFAIALFAVLAYRSGSLGARIFLGLDGPAATRIAVWASLVSTLPVLLAAPLSAAR
jgi:hypothetical protein